MAIASDTITSGMLASGGITPAKVARLAPEDVQAAHPPVRVAGWLKPRQGLFSLAARPVFAVGKHKGHTYTSADLKRIVEAFEPTLHQIQPVLKLGHAEAQLFAKGKGVE